MFTQFCSRISSSKAFFCISPAQKLLLSHSSNHHRNEFEKFKSILQRRHSSFWIQRSVGSLFKFVGKRRMLHSVLIDLLIYIFYRLVRVIVQLESDLFLLGRKLWKSDKICEETGKPVVEILNIIARRDIFN